MRLFLDINVVLDVLAERDPRVEDSAVVLSLLEQLTVIELDQELLLGALSLGWEDVEDAVRGVSAQRARADYLVTGNPSDFDPISLPVVTPSELVAILDSETR